MRLRGTRVLPFLPYWAGTRSLRRRSRSIARYVKCTLARIKNARADTVTRLVARLAALSTFFLFNTRARCFVRHSPGALLDRFESIARSPFRNRVIVYLVFSDGGGARETTLSPYLPARIWLARVSSHRIARMDRRVSRRSRSTTLPRNPIRHSR